MRIGTSLACKLGKLDGFARRIGTRTGNDRYASGDMFNRSLDQLAMFFNIHCRRLTRGTDHHHCVTAFGNMPIQQLAQTRQIETAVIVHRGNEGGYGTGNHQSSDQNKDDNKCSIDFLCSTQDRRF